MATHAPITGALSRASAIEITTVSEITATCDRLGIARLPAAGSLYAEAMLFCRLKRISPTRLGGEAANDRGLIHDLKKGRRVRDALRVRLVGYMACQAREAADA